MPKTTLAFVTFCQQRAENAGRPGQASQNIQLNAVRTPHLQGKEEVDPNGKLFTDVNGNLSLSLSGPTDEVAAMFKGGKKYLISIEPID